MLMEARLLAERREGIAEGIAKGKANEKLATAKHLNRPPKVRPKNLILGGRFFNGKIQF